MDYLTDELHHGKASVLPQNQVLMFMWYIANKDSYRVVARLFDVYKSTAHKYIHKVSSAVCDIAPRLLVWPSHDQQEEISRNVEMSTRIPNCVGFIDGSHIRLQSAPGGDKDYTNRKGYHSMQVQVVVDDKMIITDCYVGWPGSSHDARVFSNSPIRDAMENGNILAANKYVFGDSAYPLSSYILVPFRDNGHLTAGQRHFNRLLSSGRQAVERAFGLIKGRFRQLRNIESTNVPHICQLITAGCVLHNL